MRFKVCACLAFVLCAHAHLCCAVQLQFGDIVAPQFDNNGTIVVVHPDGNRELLSLYPDTGSGPSQSRPTSIVRMPDGSFLVTEAFLVNGLYSIDQHTGDRTFVSGLSFPGEGLPASRGTGLIDHPLSVLKTSGGQVYLVNQGGAVSGGFITRVDLATGDRTLISGRSAGAGPAFGVLSSGSLTEDDHLIVPSGSSLIDVDLETGLRTVVSGPSRGQGPALDSVMDLVVLPNGQVIVSDRHASDGFPFVSSLIRVDPSTGDRTVISSGPYPTFEYTRIALGFNGQLLGSVSTQDAIYSIDPNTGARTLISSTTFGSGPHLFWGDMVAIVPIPEPSSLALAAFGIAGLAAWGWRRRSR